MSGSPRSRAPDRAQAALSTRAARFRYFGGFAARCIGPRSNSHDREDIRHLLTDGSWVRAPSQIGLAGALSVARWGGRCVLLDSPKGVELKIQEADLSRRAVQECGDAIGVGSQSSGAYTDRSAASDPTALPRRDAGEFARQGL